MLPEYKNRPETNILKEKNGMVTVGYSSDHEERKRDMKTQETFRRYEEKKRTPQNVRKEKMEILTRNYGKRINEQNNSRGNLIKFNFKRNLKQKKKHWRKKL